MGPYPLTNRVADVSELGTLTLSRYTGADVAEVERTGSVTVAAVAAVVGVADDIDDVADNADDVLGFTLFLEGAGLVVRFDFFDLGRRGQDEGRWILGAVGCAFGKAGELAVHLETRF